MVSAPDTTKKSLALLQKHAADAAMKVVQVMLRRRVFVHDTTEKSLVNLPRPVNYAASMGVAIKFREIIYAANITKKSLEFVLPKNVARVIVTRWNRREASARGTTKRSLVLVQPRVVNDVSRRGVKRRRGRRAYAEGTTVRSLGRA